MTNLTLTINLDRLSAAQLAALQVILLEGMDNGAEKRAAREAVKAAGIVNCGDEYLEELERAEDFLSQS